MFLEAKNITKRFGSIEALKDVSFQVRSGEILGLIGPNGAGKSTLFECLAGVMPACAGDVVARGSAIEPANRSSFLFYVPDNITPWPHETVRWALDFTIGFFGGQGGRREELVEQLALRDVLTQKLGTLSKGQRKRVLLGIGLLTSQPLLLIDEPFDGLDLRQGRDVADVLRAHAARGRTLFLSIHQINEAARLCDRFVLLNSGCVKGQGNLQELAAAAQELCPGRVLNGLEEIFLALT